MAALDDDPLYPLLGFSAGVIDGAVGLRLECATTPAEYATREGEARQYVMTPAAAIELGQALIERGELARGASRA